EWSMALVLKTNVGIFPYRGFESHPHRQMLEISTVNHPLGCIEAVATNNNGQVGRVFAICIGETADLLDFHVNRNFRKSGIGTELMEIAENDAARDGAKRIMRIGFFCDVASIPEYFQTLKFLKTRGYKNFILFQVKDLSRNSNSPNFFHSRTF
ncbi:MAG TPA: GNAT family N-acetyltransferase, partial [Patescibacteria group bacterium]|nr:GNAT family N-acetyltransferase [Patescibacteria group bacterium]